MIGRGQANDITLDDDWVSAQHVRLRRQNGAWLAEDLGSTNGTRVNGRPLKGAGAGPPRRRAGPRPRQVQAGGAAMIGGATRPALRLTETGLLIGAGVVLLWAMGVLSVALFGHVAQSSLLLMAAALAMMLLVNLLLAWRLPARRPGVVPGGLRSSPAWGWS